jgi:serine/threonine protein kinase/tetratricopeptide (TPR) repeat protein
MTPERWRRVERLYHAARARPLDDRAAFLDCECGDDVELRREVESLLAQPVSGKDFLESPALAVEMISSPPGIMAPGQRIGVYRIEALLGAGGMGEVYRAHDMKLGRDVAMKILPPAFTRDPERRGRFEQEARVLASLNHPHIAAIYGTEEAGGVHALVLELVEGETLAEKLGHVSRRQSPVRGLPIAEALAIARQIAHALDAAHKKGIIHRDLKPANVTVTPEGVVKVLDFGLAKAMAGTGPPLDLTHAPTLAVGETRDGLILGTAAYMSPEQARGRPVDKRTDVWAFGCVLYELLAGRAAFARETVTDTLAAIIERDPEWQALPPATPPAIVRLLRRCLEKDPGRRLHDIADARIELDDADADRVAATAGVESQPATRSTPFRRMAASATLLVIGLAIGGWWVLSPHAHALTDKDTIVLADFRNTTGDEVFDETLRRGLSVQLEQSPFLSLVSDERIRKTLGLMGQPADARLTPALAREVCERAGAAAMLEGSIAPLGTQYVLGLRASNCRTGDVLDEEQDQAPRKEDVLNVLSQIAKTFRTRVGESLATVEKHSTPLVEATTPSLEALKAFSTAWRVNVTAGGVTALPLFKRAVDIDPQFALAWVNLGLAQSGLGEAALSAESTTRGYELRNRASDRERFFIATMYDRQVTGNLEREMQTLTLWAQTYPRDATAHGLLAGFGPHGTGQYELCIQEAQKAKALDPEIIFSYGGMVSCNLYLDRLDAAERAWQRAVDLNMTMGGIPVLGYHLAFLKGDSAAMDRQAAVARSRPGGEEQISHLEALILARSGRLQQAANTSRHAMDVAEKAGHRERAALYQAAAAVWKALFGNAAEGRRLASAAVQLSRGRDVEYASAFALGLAGDTSQSQAIATDLDKRYPEDTSVRTNYLPALRALAALRAGQPLAAIDQLEPARPYELADPAINFVGFFGCFYPPFVRGEAYLAAHRAAEAAAEFQRILDHRGLLLGDPLGAAVRVQLGRALALSGDGAKAKAAYQDFLRLWKDADPDIPILAQAGAEYAKLK